MIKLEYALSCLDKGILVAVADSDGKKIWSATKSPAGSAVRAAIDQEIPHIPNAILLADQLGIALAVTGHHLGIHQFACRHISAPARELLERSNDSVWFEAEVPLISSSTNPSITCPVERGLATIGIESEGRLWRSLCERFAGAEAGKSCSINRSR